MKLLIFIIGISFVVASCDPFMYYDEYSKTEGEQWKWSDKKTFEVEVKDSLNMFSVLVNIRHTTDYPKSNLFVFISTTSPTGASRRDTLEIIIAEDNGKWKGNGFGNIKLVSREYRKAVRFASPGIYTFEIEQGMRIPEIPVTDVGLRIEEYRELR